MNPKIVVKVKDGRVVKRYQSTRQAGLYESLSHQAIINRCNGIVKSDYQDEYQFRWGVEDEKHVCDMR